MEPNDLSYSERQRFRQWWLWTLVLIGPAISLGTIFQDIVLSSSFDTNPTNYSFLIILGVAFPLFMYTTGLDTQVGKLGVFVCFRPFHRKWLVFRFDDIHKAESHIYRPLKDYGGWGIRSGRGSKAYNVSGDKGVLLTMKDGKTIMIGSKNHEVLCSAIKEQLPRTLER